MPRVQRLSDDLINKIAAGEVVERPASVVKELVENAIDAGARSVLVEIEHGGKSLVKVRDDGMGMGRDDAARATERHATSKLRTLDDLQAIGTKGFRGEALSSIASVSQLELLTREEGASAGTLICVRHGHRDEPRDAAHPRGTTVTVRDLFGGVPARRKFLRGDTTEAAHVAETLTLLALAHPGLGFTLRSRERNLIEAPPVADREARLFQLFGREALLRSTAVDGGREWARVRGFVTTPGRGGSSRPALRLFVNGRAVRDRALAKAVGEGYRRAGVTDPKGDAFLFVEVPLHLVDVNVHPAKSEVRFADARTVWEAVVSAVSEALGRGGKDLLAKRPGAERVAEATERYLSRAAGEPAVAGAPGRPDGQAHPALEVPAPRARSAGEALIPAGEPSVLGQHRNTYIVASDGEELVLVDQHTAHERVRFERVVATLSSRRVESQRLLTPAVHVVAPRLRPLLEAHAESLSALGFEIEPFGGDSIRVAAVPALLGVRDPGPALEALLRELLSREASDWIVASDRDRLAATLACHSAVKAGQPLSREVMAAIVRDLAHTDHPAVCPHGRPTVVRIPREDVSRWFGRTGWRRQ